MQNQTQIFLGGVDYSGISGSELTRVIIRKGGPRVGDAEESAAVFIAAFGRDPMTDPNTVWETVPAVQR